MIVAERFCGGITEAEKRQLFDEHVPVVLGCTA